MAFQKRKVGEKNTSQSYKKRKAYKKKAFQKRNKQAKNWKIFSKFVWYVIIWLFTFGLICLFVLYQKIIAPLPSISELENLDIAEASVIYDREGNELYKIFEEKRTYVYFDGINKNIINALVAWEDQRFWENPWVDFIGLVRAGIYGVIWKNEWFWGTSTLTQQLIRNTIIENRSSQESVFDKLERKIKEIYLAFKLTNGVSKEKIIELYLNKIAFWSNAYGVEQAAKTFFGKSASEASVFESSILASLPKWPSYYSPYSNFDRLVWYPYIYSGEESDVSIDITSPASLQENREIVSELENFISDFKVKRYSESKALICGLDKEKVKSNISLDKDGCSVMDYAEFLTLLNSIKISSWDQTIEYQTGRKDFILGRMLEDNYITFDEYKTALLESIWYSFKPYSEDIKYPHFVFYVREFLEEKYGKDILETWGLKIYTSIDPKLQDKAEEIIKAQSESNNTRFGAQNASLISLNNETGEILAMVWGRDYFDEEHKWNVNMVTSALQPWSSFKPFVYSVAIDSEVIWSKTPIYDVKTTFPGNYTPQNFDGKFMGKMNVSTALNNSRNIPAIKMYFLAGGEEKILTWLDKLWVTTPRSFRDEYSASSWTNYTYGASMALGSVMMSPLELAQAYSVYANLGRKKELIPVIKILDSKGLVIEEFNPEQNMWVEVFDPSTAYITNHILSDTTTRPSFWNNYLSLNWRKAAAKTGTSTKWSSGWWNTVYPRNLWTAWYTPQITTVVWAGNNDGSETNLKWNGLEAAGPIWKNFMEFAHWDKSALEWRMPAWVKKVNISDLSGKLAPEDFNNSFISSSLFVNAPQNYDNNLKTIQVDLLCNGLVDENTPISAIWNVNLLSVTSLRPNDAAWENPVQAWIKESNFLWSLNLSGNYLASVNNQSCERTWVPWNIEIAATVENGENFVIGSNYIQIWYKSDTPLRQIDVFLDEVKIKQIDIPSKTSGVYTWDIPIPKESTWVKNLVFRAIDTQYFSEGISYDINVLPSDTTPPNITVTNPIDGTIALNSWDFFNIRWNVEDRSTIRSINIYIDNNPIKIGLTGREFVWEISSENLSLWEHTIKVEAVDFNFNIGSQEIILNIL